MAIARSVMRVAPMPMPMAAPVERPLLLVVWAGACVDVDVDELGGATVVTTTEGCPLVDDIEAVILETATFVVVGLGECDVVTIGVAVVEITDEVLVCAV
jgi:hypothetical protein